jgi:hypothetical protein
MSIETIGLNVWGTAYNLPVEYCDSIDADCAVAVEQSLLCFSANSAAIIEEARTAVTSYVQKTAYAIGISDSESLEACVEPQMLLVRADEDKSVNIAVLCGFKYDPEHDLAMVFSDQKLVEVGNQDLVVWW